MNNFIFTTGGDWDSTTLYNNGQEVMAEQMFVELTAGRDGYGEPTAGGISAGGEVTAIIRPQDNPDAEIGIFPGRLEMNCPGHTLIMENTHPNFAFEFTRVWHNGQDVTNHVMDIRVDIDKPNNNVQAFITLFKPHWIAADEVATYNIL